MNFLYLITLSCILIIITADDYTYDEGGIRRGSTSKKHIALIFTGGGYSEGAPLILDALRDRNLSSSFFVTGDYLRTESFIPYLERIVTEGHYLGSHSDSHPLYCEWENRNITLVTREFFEKDLMKGVNDLCNKFGIKRDAMKYWIPPYEYYNWQISEWSKHINMTLFDYTPGTLSHTDYCSESEKCFHPSIEVMKNILNYESTHEHGLNGFFLLFHLGSGPNRRDKMAPFIPQIIDVLLARGYSFVTVPQMIPIVPYV